MEEQKTMSQTGKDKPIVFVSHVEEDAAVASEIKNWLEDNLLVGVEVFVSSDYGIKPGDKWEERIIEKLKNCRIALVVCTQMSVKQPWVNFEAGGAWVKGVRVIPLCYHGQRKETLPRPLSRLDALDLSEPDDISELLKIIAEEAGLRAPEIDPKGLMERLPQRNYEELTADVKLPDIRVKDNLAMASGGQGGVLRFLSLEAQNHDKNSVFLGYPSIAIQNSRERLAIVRDSAFHLPVPTGELKSGDSRSILVDPTEIGIENIKRLREVIFPDKIGREFKGSAEDTLNAIKAWKSASQKDRK
ncbi:MAG: toll/interleukin-1 receptor domain-containing protein [Methanophagales archaeon]|nr:toll/interleukin-1 receptor domain-containing protein [Methanophagales archaeon]